ncbi:class I SAM-dependent methyltransferase [Candidatus Bathyarchaeota archaeon A05DMB-2]|nr:class I SAM-dependent methyltransferase [Candidatus Bathyarchaeota archaeon A05DMB-2]
MSHYRFPGEDALRRKWHTPENTLKSVGLRPGMVFMDIGCGYGFFTIPAAEQVGENGRVYAVDADAEAVEAVKRKAAEKGLRNIVVKAAEAEETIFCDACADMVFFSIVLHDFRDPAKVLSNAKRMIKPYGKLVNLDWKKKQMPYGPPLHIRFSVEHAQALIEQAGFRVESVREAGSNFYLVTAKP